MDTITTKVIMATVNSIISILRESIIKATAIRLGVAWITEIPPPIPLQTSGICSTPGTPISLSQPIRGVRVSQWILDSHSLRTLATMGLHQAHECPATDRHSLQAHQPAAAVAAPVA
jgi:hypothetical protein